MQQIRDAHLLQQIRTVVTGRSVHRQTHRNAQPEHFRDPCDPRRELHVGDRAVRDAGSGPRKLPELFIVEMDAVGVPDVVSEPAQAVHVFQRTHAETAQGEVLFISRLRQMGMEPHPVGSRQHRRFPEEILRDGEGRAGRESDPVHRAAGGIVIPGDETFAVRKDRIDVLNDAVGRQSPVLDGQIHTPAGRVKAHADGIRGSELRVY